MVVGHESWVFALTILNLVPDPPLFLNTLSLLEDLDLDVGVSDLSVTESGCWGPGSGLLSSFILKHCDDCFGTQELGPWIYQSLTLCPW